MAIDDISDDAPMALQAVKLLAKYMSGQDKVSIGKPMNSQHERLVRAPLRSVYFNNGVV